MQNLHLLACPLCRLPVGAAEGRSLVCPNGHTFDIAQKGYVNFLTKPVHMGYGKAMLQARRRIAGLGFWDGLLDALAALARDPLPSALLDAGCGEGSILCGLKRRMEGTDVALSGIDISKEGIRLAAAERCVFWGVADLTNLPFGDGVFDCILNCLAPFNDAEFRRVLRPGGLVLKVVPSDDYLLELRRLLHGGEKAVYSNAQVVAHFSEKFEIVKTVSVCDAVTLTHDALPDLLHMTPLGWNADADRMRAALDLRELRLTVALAILVGRPVS